MSYLCDTNVISELRRNDRANSNVLAWARTVPDAATWISAMTVFELELGCLRLARRDAAQAAVLRRWIDTLVLPRFHGRILPVDTAVAQRCAALHVPDPRAERDALIAATALVHGLTVVTRNVADFAATGVPLFDPWA